MNREYRIHELIILETLTPYYFLDYTFICEQSKWRFKGGEGVSLKFSLLKRVNTIFIYKVKDKDINGLNRVNLLLLKLVSHT